MYREKTKTKVLAYTRTLPLARMVMASKMVTGSATPLLSSLGLARGFVELSEGLTKEVCPTKRQVLKISTDHEATVAPCFS